MPEITTGVSFDTVAREWRCKFDPADDKASLAAAQKVLDKYADGIAKITGLKSINRTVCGTCSDFKVAISVDAGAFGAWEAAKFEPEEQFLADLKAVAGLSAIETQTFTYMPVKPADGFLAKIAEATNAVGAANILAPPAAKAFVDENPGTLLLDVQDPGSESIPGAHSASLGTLPFKASTDLADFTDPVITGRAKDAPIVITCALGGQALLAGKLLRDYGYTSVKVIDGGCTAWKKAGI